MVSEREMLRRLAPVGIYKSMLLDMVRDNNSQFSNDRNQSILDLNAQKARLNCIKTDDVLLKEALSWFKFATFEDLKEACTNPALQAAAKPEVDDGAGLLLSVPSHSYSAPV
jgi:hypothetical protein